MHVQIQNNVIKLQHKEIHNIFISSYINILILVKYNIWDIKVYVEWHLLVKLVKNKELYLIRNFKILILVY